MRGYKRKRKKNKKHLWNFLLTTKDNSFVFFFFFFFSVSFFSKNYSTCPSQFQTAPSPKDFHQETVRKLKGLHLFDCLRANKSTSAWGVEARVPFLDRDFLDTAMTMDPIQKMCVDPISNKPRMEKYTLRKAFDTPEDPYLPNEVLWRQKEQFSDGVGYTWIDSLREMAEKEVTGKSSF